MTKRTATPIAAFALMAAIAITATSAYAFSPDLLKKIDVGLTEAQISTLEEAKNLKENGVDRKEVKTFLEENGIDGGVMKEVKNAVREVHHEMREMVSTALENDDYDAFLIAVADSPLADAINSEADFETLKAAHELKEAGDQEGARELMAELGIEKPGGHGHRKGYRGEHRGKFGGPNSE